MNVAQVASLGWLLLYPIWSIWLGRLLLRNSYSGGLLLSIPESGKMLAVRLWENKEAMHATDEASYWFRTFGAGAAEGKVADVETYEVYRARLTHPQP